MPFNSLVSRADAASLIPEDAAAEIIKSVPETSIVMQLARRLGNMSTNQRRLPIMQALATAYFVNGDTGLKQTTDMSWANKYIDAEEIAVIVPIPEAVLDDSSFAIWDEVRPSVIEAFGIAIDQAVLYGTNIPASWTTNLGAAGLVALSTAAGNTVSLAAYTDLYEALLGETAAGVAGSLGALELDGYVASGHVADTSMRRKLRNVRDADGQPIFRSNMQDSTRFDLDGSPIYFPTNGAISAATALMISGQWDQLVYAIRQDITWKLLTEATIQDAAGNTIYNLAQQDMVALRGVMRLGFALPNPINRMQPTAASRAPFSVLTA